MKKLLISSLILSLTVAISAGKVVRRQLSILPSSVPETETLAPETMEFVYDYSWCCDTTKLLEKNRDGDRMLLQIGPDGLSKFSSYKNLTVDSIILKSTREQIIDAAVEGKLSTGEFMTIYKNYPQGKLTHTEKICEDWFRYDENMPEFDWELTDSTTTVLGHECRGARTYFRGREWNVFYAEDIPIMEGPWKFHGLPGLIMKASDCKGEYLFECIGIDSKGTRPITIYKVPFNRTDRHEYYDARHRYDVNPYAYYEATGGVHVDVVDESGNPSVGAYDPIDLQYDYIETGWRK